MSPAYDLVATVLYERPGHPEALALKLGGTQDFQAVDAARFAAFARAAHIDEGLVRRWALDAADRVRQAWADHAADLGFTAPERARLDAHLARVPLGRA
jgi:hypothetical protein